MNNESTLIGLFLAAIGLVACDGSQQSEGGKAAENAAAQVHIECSSRTVADCSGDGLCNPIIGSRLSEAASCADAGEYVTCQDLFGCGEAVTYARDPSGDLWRFPDTCTPAGWAVDYPLEPVFECANQKATADTCVSRPEADCSGDGRCNAIVGSRFTETAPCGEPGRFVTCEELAGCGEVLTYARDPSGDLWRFPDTCTPEGWPVEYLVEPPQSCNPPAERD